MNSTQMENSILHTLNGEEFVDRSLNKSIKFNKAIINGSSGIIYNLKNEKVYPYSIEIKDSRVFIDCEYFGTRHCLEIIPTGFYLRYPVENEITEEYINKFCIDNQLVFKGILEHLVRTGDNGLPNTRESLAKIIQSVFPNTHTWREICDIVERVIDIMEKNKTVSCGERLGERTIAFTKNTKMHLETNIYSWSRKP